MSDTVTVAVIAAVSSLLLALVNLVVAAIQRRQSKKSGIQARLDSIENMLDKLSTHSDMQYLSLLRLTVIDSDMPMSERLIAGKEYITRGGNGDVKAFYEELEKKVNK